MENDVEKFSVLSRSEDKVSMVEEPVARELPVTIILNNQELVTLLCSPNDLKYLAAGFLFSERLLKSKDEIKKILADDKRGVIRVDTVEDKEMTKGVLFKRLITSGCGSGITFYRAADITDVKLESQRKVSTDEILSIVNKFQHSSGIYSKTHGVHSAAISDGESILAFSEDVGRHNAIDKVIGKCFLKDISTTDRIVITSGRVSSEILYKIAKAGIPIIISISVPTNLGIRIADALGITLLGSVKAKRFKVYANHWRVIT